MAVKIFNSDSTNDFENERDVLSRIRNSRSGHVNVLVNYGSLVYGEHHMLFLPWTNLGTLDDFISFEEHRDTTAKKRNIIYCIIDVADALAWLTKLKISLPHKFREVQVMHCDIKPQNILIFPDSTRENGFIFKVSDFGHAFMSSSIETQSRRYESTYCAPETRERGSVEKTSDVWPYGCILLLVLIFTTRGPQEIIDLRADLSRRSTIDTFYQSTNYQLKESVSDWIDILRDGKISNADINETEMTKAMGKILHDDILVSDHKSRKTMDVICGNLKEAYNKLYTAVQTSSLTDHKGILRRCESCAIPAKAEYVCLHDEDMNSYGIFFTDTLHFRGRLELVMPMSPRGRNWEKQFTLNVSTCASSHICLVKKAPPRMEQANLEVRQNQNQRLANETWQITKNIQIVLYEVQRNPNAATRYEGFMIPWAQHNNTVILAISPNGNWIATCTRTGTGKEVRYKIHVVSIEGLRQSLRW